MNPADVPPAPSLWEPKLPARNQEIHPGAAVHCPKFSYEMTAAAVHCPGCPHYKGLVLLVASENEAVQAGMRWDQVYCVLCTYAIERKTHIINIIT